MKVKTISKKPSILLYNEIIFNIFQFVNKIFSYKKVKKMTKFASRIAYTVEQIFFHTVENLFLRP